jgi:hypothetical protein
MIICFVLPKCYGCAEISCSLENHVPHINAPAEFNQDTSEFAHERRNCLQSELHARQCIELTMPTKTPQERRNCLCREQHTV